MHRHPSLSKEGSVNSITSFYSFSSGSPSRANHQRGLRSSLRTPNACLFADIDNPAGERNPNTFRWQTPEQDIRISWSNSHVYRTSERLFRVSIMFFRFFSWSPSRNKEFGPIYPDGNSRRCRKKRPGNYSACCILLLQRCSSRSQSLKSEIRNMIRSRERVLAKNNGNELLKNSEIQYNGTDWSSPEKALSLIEAWNDDWKRKHYELRWHAADHFFCGQVRIQTLRITLEEIVYTFRSDLYSDHACSRSL